MKDYHARIDLSNKRQCTLWPNQYGEATINAGDTVITDYGRFEFVEWNSIYYLWCKGRYDEEPRIIHVNDIKDVAVAE